MRLYNNMKKSPSQSEKSREAATGRLTKAVIACLLAVVMLGGAATLAYLTHTTDALSNVFHKGKRYTLTYHANTGSDAGDAEVTVPEKETKYGDGMTSVEFEVSDDRPAREGFVFKGWYEKETPESGDIKYGDQGEGTLTAPVEQYESHLYAKWEAGYTLIYDANGGEGTPAITKGDPDEEISGNTVTRTTGEASYTFTNLAKQGEMTGPKESDGTADHRVFLGWSTDKDAEEPELTNDGKLAYANTDSDYDKAKVDGFGNEVKIDAEDNPSKTVTLYAVWATKYVLDYQYHPDMLAISDPKCGTVLPENQTLVSTKAEHSFKLPEEKDTNRPTRTGGYTWGWWGDDLDRFGYVETLPTSAPVNEGCYLFDETIKPIRKDAPTQTLYAYFQPPREATVLFDKNTSWMPTSGNIHSSAYDRDGTVYPMPNPCYGYTNEHEYIPWEDGVPTTIPRHSVEYNGNTYADRYVFKGWAYTANATEPDVMPGQKDFSINMVLSNKVTLYAVWESGHNYKLYFDYNAGNNTRRVYYQNAAKQWISNQNSSGENRVWFSSDDWSNKDVYRSTPFEYFNDSSYTWSRDFFKDRGVFATRADDSVGTYKFLGWSYEQQAPSVNPEELTVDFPVEIPGPADKVNPNPLDPDLSSITGDIGLITKDVTFDEPDASCTTPKTHSVTLYAVWQRSPKHQLALVFNKGTASNNIGSASYYAPSSSGYVASVDLPEKTWTADDLKNLTVPTRSADAETGSTYEFIGWTDEDTHATLKEAGVGTEADVKIHIDPSTKKINEPVTVKEPKDNPRHCEGGRHTYNYYPVFKKTARHRFVVNYDINSPAPITGSTIEVNFYRSADGNTWTKEKVVNKNNPATGETREKGQLGEETADLSKIEYTYPLNGKGMFATCVNTSPTASSTYTFKGWSYTQYALGEYNEEEDGPLDFPVTAPSDPDNPGGSGILGADVVIREADEDPQCSVEDNMGKKHERTLYGVWEGEPLHQFSLVFVGGTDATIVYGNADDWTNGTTKTSNATIAKGTTDFKGTGLEEDGTGKLKDALVNTWKADSDMLPMPKEATDPKYSKSFDFDEDYWTENGNIVKATRKDSNGYRYEFAGWSTEPDQQEGNVNVDTTTGLISSKVTATDQDYPNCPSETHHVVLYAAWKPTKIHNYQVVFYANGGSEIGRNKDDGTWEANRTSGIHTYTRTLYKSNVVGIMNPDDVPNSMGYTISVSTAKDIASTYTSHEWKTTDPDDQRLRVEAKRANATVSGKKYRYTFEGWAESPEGDVKYTVDDKSFLRENLKIEAPHGTGEDDCGDYTHTVVLYAKWKTEEIPPEPPKHRFSLIFNLNSGNYFRKYDSTAGEWKSVSAPTIYEPSDASYELSSEKDSYTWPESYFSDNGMGGAIRNDDTYYTYEFVGWSTERMNPTEEPDMTKVDIPWEQDSGSMVKGDGYIKSDIQSAICPGNDANDATATHPKTLYAVWKRTPRTKSYTLLFDGNSQTAQGVPANRENEIETYDGTTKWNKHTFDISDTADPTNLWLVFAGWSEEKNASSGQYGNPYLSDDDEDRKEMTRHLSPLFTTEPALANNVYESTKTLYAIWLYEYRLEYVANGDGAMNAPPHMHAYDKAPQKTTRLREAIPSWEGHTFLGWATDPNAAAPQYQPNQQITIHDNGDIDEEPDKTGRAKVTLYAVWKAN